VPNFRIPRPASTTSCRVSISVPRKSSARDFLVPSKHLRFSSGDGLHGQSVWARCGFPNFRRSRERIIERASELDVTASAFVAAVHEYSKIDAAGQLIERTCVRWKRTNYHMRRALVPCRASFRLGIGLLGTPSPGLSGGLVLCSSEQCSAGVQRYQSLNDCKHKRSAQAE
jgi:hypothetical protein